MRLSETISAQGLEYSPGDIRTGRIEHGVVVGKRNEAERPPVVVDVKRSPAAVFGLHVEQPLDGAALAGLLVGGTRRARTAQAQQHLSGVVDIRIKLVGE